MSRPTRRSPNASSPQSKAEVGMGSKILAIVLPSWNNKKDTSTSTSLLHHHPVLRKATALQSHPTEESFPELPDVLVWIRAVIAVLFGCYVGYYHPHNPTRNNGATVFQALNLFTFVPYTYCKWFLGTPTGVFDMSVLFGGTPQAMCLFLLVWIYLFTAAHPLDEAALSAMLVSVLPDNNGTGAAEGAGATAASSSSSEF